MCGSICLPIWTGIRHGGMTKVPMPVCRSQDGQMMRDNRIMRTDRPGGNIRLFLCKMKKKKKEVENMKSIVLLPTKYLMHKIRSKCSPNTVRRSALAILYYLEYIHEKKKELTDVYQMPYVEQTNHFVEFLYWLKAGKHTRDKNHRSPNNGTCNAYLRDVFRFYLL